MNRRGKITRRECNRANRVFAKRMLGRAEHYSWVAKDPCCVVPRNGKRRAGKPTPEYSFHGEHFN